MKKIVISVIGLFIPFILLYLCFAFIYVSIDFSKWTYSSRSFVAIFGLICGIALAVIFITQIDETTNTAIKDK